MTASRSHRAAAGLAVFVLTSLLPPGDAQAPDPASAASQAHAQARTVEVTLLVRLHTSQAVEGRPYRHAAASDEGAVLWLTPQQAAAPRPPAQTRTFELVQKDKQFVPRLLVIPTGSFVDFPNLDPFFHNVFSLFNGKRFDLGLYEAHTHRAVRFDREGVSYIFCNIHPQMGAVIISLNTPFYATSPPSGHVVIAGVPPGAYRLHLWAENVPAAQLTALERDVQIDSAHTQLGTLTMQPTGDLLDHHDNKFGKPYPPEPKPVY